MASLQLHDQPLGQKLARHLLRRASFKYTKALVDQFSLLTPTQALDLLTQNLGLTLNLPYDPQPDASPHGYWTESSDINLNFIGGPRKAAIVACWWWYNAINDGTLKYKLSHFLTTRFTVEKNNGATGTSAEFYDYIRLTLFYAYGNYKTFAKKIVVDNTMLAYLGNTFNNKNSPNENFAREFFELFTIGKGKQIEPGNYTNYTENDIVEAAKLLSGFKRKKERDFIDIQTGLPKGVNSFGQHNVTTKKFSTAFDIASIAPATDAASMDNELSQFVEMIYKKTETAKHFCRKLYIYFVKSNITEEIERDIITPLSAEFYANNYEILPTIKRLLQSKHFYDLDDTNSADETIGGIIKSPLQMLSEICTYLHCDFPNPTTNPKDFYILFWERFAHNTFFVNANMLPFDPDNVAGHQAYYQSPEFDKTWISSATLIARYRLGESLLDGVNRIAGNATIVAKINISKVIKDNGLVSNAANPNILCAELCNAIFGQEPDTDRLNYFKTNFLLQGLDDFYWTSEWNKYVNTNNNSVVEPRLSSLLKKILGAPEAQIF